MRDASLGSIRKKTSVPVHPHYTDSIPVSSLLIIPHLPPSIRPSLPPCLPPFPPSPYPHIPNLLQIIAMEIATRERLTSNHPLPEGFTVEPSQVRHLLWQTRVHSSHPGEKAHVASEHEPWLIAEYLRHGTVSNPLLPFSVLAYWCRYR